MAYGSNSNNVSSQVIRNQNQQRRLTNGRSSQGPAMRAGSGTGIGNAQNTSQQNMLGMNNTRQSNVNYVFSDTRQPYRGPIHIMGNGEVHSGKRHTIASRKLTPVHNRMTNPMMVSPAGNRGASTGMIPQNVTQPGSVSGVVNSINARNQSMTGGNMASNPSQGGMAGGGDSLMTENAVGQIEGKVYIK